MVLQSSPMNSTKSREVIWGGRIITAAKINAEQARQRAVEAVREADRAEALRGPFEWRATAGRRNPHQPSPNASTAVMAAA
jgi:hypothetical protein